MNYDFIILDPVTFSPGQWDEYYQMREQLHLRYHVAFNFGRENFRNGIMHAIEKNGFTIWIIRHEKKMIGFASYWIMNPGHPTAQNNVVQCVVPEEHMGAKVQRQALECILQKMSDEKHEKCLWRTSHPPMIRLMQEVGAVPSNSGCWFRLNPQDTEPSLINKWLNAVDLSSLGLKSDFTEFLPDHLVEETAALSHLLVNDMVREDTSVSFNVTPEYLRNTMDGCRKIGQLPLHLFLRDSSNNLVGISVLMIVPPGNKADQKLTGIIPEWRGKGLARWLKAAMLNIVKNDHKSVREVTTECFSKNAPMIRINKDLGYELYKTDHDFHIMAPLLESFLKKGEK